MNIERMESSIDRYSEGDPQRASLLSFFSAIWKTQEEIAEGLPATDITVDPDAAGDALATHQPLFMLAQPQIPADEYIKAVQAISALVSEHAGLGEDTSAALEKAGFAEAITSEILEDALDDVDAFTSAIAEKLEADVEGPLTPVTLDFILSTSMTPFLERPAAAIVKSVGEVDWRIWSSGECPVCGTPASNARIVDEGELQGGRRVLSCPLCRTEWDYERVRCARCGNRSHNDLHYFLDERDPGHRIHVCEACHGYIKVSFERDLDISVIPQVEDIVTLPLDDLAGSKGYSALGEELDG